MDVSCQNYGPLNFYSGHKVFILRIREGIRETKCVTCGLDAKGRIDYKKTLYPVGSRVVFTYSGRKQSNWIRFTDRKRKNHKHNGHICEVVDSYIKRFYDTNYFKYRLRCLEDGSEFNTEDNPKYKQKVIATCNLVKPKE